MNSQTYFIFLPQKNLQFFKGSRFGAMLDQLTDRCTFLGLIMALCHFYPSCIFVFQFVGIIDIASHWLHLHAGDLTGKFVFSYQLENSPVILKSMGPIFSSLFFPLYFYKMVRLFPYFHTT